MKNRMRSVESIKTEVSFIFRLLRRMPKIHYQNARIEARKACHSGFNPIIPDVKYVYVKEIF